ncbi:MAG: hypothetical protein Q3972_01010 [Corynebacterium sp.]|nr:hypothetical protein [Corynebacterium sp.]
MQTPKFSKNSRVLRLLTACAFGGAALCSQAYTVTPNITTMTCIYDPNQADSAVANFWTTLQSDARAQRLDELDAVDPGLKDAILAYQNDPTSQIAGDLQTRIEAAGGTEGLAELIEAEDPNLVDQAGTALNPNLQTAYTEDQAKAAAAAISDNPAAAIEGALADGTRLGDIQTELFKQREAQYNQTQFELRKSLQDCVKALEKAKPMPLWQRVGIVIIVGLIVIVGTRAVYNNRKPVRHGK